MNYQTFPDAYFASAKDASKSPLPTATELDKGLSKFRHHLARFIKELPENAIVLDAGCGNGKAIRMIKIYRPDISIHAIDVTDVSNYLPKDVPFKVGSVDDLKEIYPPNTFDAIICLHVIEHLLYPMKMLESFNSILKNEGSVFLETPNWTRLYIPFSTMFFWNDYTHIRPFTQYGLSKLFASYNFENIKTLSVSSHDWILKNNIRKSIDIKSNKEKENKEIRPGIFARIFGRILNPLMRDTIVLIASKR